MPRTTKVALFGNNNGHGGAQEAYRRLVRYLINRGMSVKTVSVGATPITDIDREMFQRTDIAILPTSTSDLTSIAWKSFGVLKAATFLLREKPDVFICVGLSSAATFIGRAIRSHTATMAYDFIADRSSDDPRFRKALANFDIVGLQAPIMQTLHVGGGVPASRMIVLPCIQEAMSTIETSNRKYNSNSKLRLAYFGRLAPNKGLVEFISVAKAMLLHDEHVIFDIWGMGMEYPRIAEEIQRHLLAERVFLRGPYASGKDGLKLMAEYDGLFLPSLGSEGIPLVLLEAMSLGVPVICSDVGAIRDVCADNPDFLLVAPTNQDWYDGVVSFVERIRKNNFCRSRLQELYLTQYSDRVVGSMWVKFIEEARRWKR